MATAAIPVVETAQNPTEATSTNAPAATPAPAAVKAEQPAPESTTLLSEAPKSEAKAPEPKVEEVKPLAGAPEKYEFKAPDGQTYDPQVLEEFSAAAKNANLTQDAAQKLIEKMAPAIAARQQAQIESIQRTWADTSSADKEFGGEKFEENLAVARKALTTFATPEMRKLLGDTGLQHHPEVLRMLFRVGKAISEDGYVTNSAGPARTVNIADFNSVADALYPKKG